MKICIMTIYSCVTNNPEMSHFKAMSLVSQVFQDWSLKAAYLDASLRLLQDVIKVKQRLQTSAGAWLTQWL